MSPAGPADQSPARAAAIVSLRVDTVTAEVVGAMHADGVRPVLLKGPTIARWLYTDGASRPYGDSDLLVAPDDIPRAHHVLRRLGFAPASDVSAIPGWPQPAQPWIRTDDRANVDLHENLPGLRVSAHALWAVLPRELELVRVAGVDVDTLRPPARALHVAVHAAQHGNARGPIEDLSRAVESVELDIWREAAEIARALDATAVMVVGLSRVPAGSELARSLGLPAPLSAADRLLAEKGGMLVEDLRHAHGARARFVMLVGKVAPPASFMRHWSPLARRGRLGLAVAYAWRPMWLFGHALRAFVSGRRSRS